jgi:hypothetical protein
MLVNGQIKVTPIQVYTDTHTHSEVTRVTTAASCSPPSCCVYSTIKKEEVVRGEKGRETGW